MMITAILIILLIIFSMSVGMHLWNWRINFLNTIKYQFKIVVYTNVGIKCRIFNICYKSKNSENVWNSCTDQANKYLKKFVSYVEEDDCIKFKRATLELINIEIIYCDIINPNKIITVNNIIANMHENHAITV